MEFYLALKNVKILISRYGQNVLDQTKAIATDTIETASKRVV